MGVYVEDLEAIRSDPGKQSLMEKETAMIQAWLRQSVLHCTWQVLVDAIEHNAGGQNRLLATQVAAKLKEVKFHFNYYYKIISNIIEHMKYFIDHPG